MPAAEPNRALRLLVPIVVIAAGVLVVAGVFKASAPSSQTAPDEAPTAQTAPAPEEPRDADAPSGDEHDARPAGEQAGTAAAPQTETLAEPHTETADEPAPPEPPADTAAPGPAPEYHAKTQAVVDGLPTLGAADPGGEDALRLEFTQEGAGVESITLADYAQVLGATERYAVQQKTTITTPDGRSLTVAALAARGVRINGVFVDLFGSSEAPLWAPTGPGAFEAVIENGAGQPVARATRRFSISPGSYEIAVEQHLENLSASPLTYQWIQYGPVDLPEDESRYLRDPRRVWFGHLLPVETDPSRQIVERTNIRSRQNIIDKPDDPSGLLWPPADAEPGAEELVYAALSNRYFIFAVHTATRTDAAQGAFDKRLESAKNVYRVLLSGSPAPGAPPEQRVVLELHGPERSLAPGASDDLSLAAYAGPLSPRTLGRDPRYAALGLDKMIVYNIGGPCAFFTSQHVAHGMLWFLSIFHDYIVFDWALAIMVLVVFVRGVLHPITKKSQIRMQRFSKQMQALGPKQQKLKEKFKDDPKRLQQEMARLMREEGIDFTGALGCLPMFLQTPVWIALYAMLFYAFDLRHAAAYFGVFQKISGGSWGFLADLSAPDHFIDFGHTIVTLPVLGAISSINILPLILGVVFFLQQKYLTPPPSTAMSPEQQTQQRIMKVMMVVLFPLFMYQAPSGLSIYFITNSTLGIFESRYIRAHIAKLPEPEPKKRRPRPDTAGPTRPRKRVLNEGPGYKDRRKKR